MFMTNYELIYGEYKGTSGNSSSPVHREQPAPHKEKGKGTETAVKAAKAVVGAHIAAAKFAGGAVSKLSKKAVDYAKSDDAAEKAALAKEKAGAVFAGLKGKAAALAADRKKAVGGDTLDDDVIADENFHVEEAYSESDIVRDTADYNEGVSDAESFDELYKKAMDSFDDEESYDEAASLETDTEDSYNEETVNEVKEPVDAPSVDPSPAPPTSTQPKPAPRQFSYEEEKKSPVVFVLVGVIAVLLVGMGILGGMLLMKDKDNKGSENSSNDEIITTTNASVQETTSEIVTTTQKTNAEAAENVSVVSEEEIENSKNNAIADLRNKLTSEFSNNGASLPELKATTDYDINGDDIPELIISYMGIVTRIHHIYHYNGSQYVELIECWGGLEISVTNHLILEEHEEGGKSFVYYELSNDYTLKKIDEIISSPVQNGISYYRNGRQIDASEYYIAFNYYKDMNWQSIDYDYSIYAADSGNHEQSKQDQNASSMYTGYANIENAPSNMTFVDNSDSNVIPKGIIKTDSTGLNLRKGPGTSYEVILEIPKGDSVSVYGQNSEWCYVGWKAPTRTVDGSYPVFYGYVSKDYLSIGVG